MLNIGLSGKFVPILKENLNAEDLNFSIHLLNLNLLRHELFGQPNVNKISLYVNNIRFKDEISQMIYTLCYSEKRSKIIQINIKLIFSRNTNNFHVLSADGGRS